MKRFVFVAILTAATASSGRAQTASCDRACLTGIADSYIAALVAHDPSKAPIASGFDCSVNFAPVAIGAFDGSCATSAAT